VPDGLADSETQTSNNPPCLSVMASTRPAIPEHKGVIDRRKRHSTLVAAITWARASIDRASQWT
jgi:hypothetical protein